MNRSSNINLFRPRITEAKKRKEKKGEGERIKISKKINKIGEGEGGGERKRGDNKFLKIWKRIKIQ
jgi:hypothetical protein